MPTAFVLRATLLLMTVFTVEVLAEQAVPAVYRDEYVQIRASIPEIGLRPIHIGDAISLVVQVEFDAEQVRVENLDSDFFQRAFANQKSIKLYAPPLITRATENGGHVRIRASWPFQVLDCPGDLANCPGDKIYDLPVIPVSYQLIDKSGEVLNDKSARFRPWPGKIGVSPALSAKAPGELEDHFPGGAYPQALSVKDWRPANLLAIFVGALLVGAGFSKRLFKRKPRHHVVHSRSPENRWESALSCLRDTSLPDDQWTDLLRRCASWYCLDELGSNPYAQQSSTDFHLFFHDVLNEESIGPDRRNEFLARFIQLAEETVGSLTMENDS